jgi:hypothetical protein
VYTSHRYAHSYMQVDGDQMYSRIVLKVLQDFAMCCACHVCAT